MAEELALKQAVGHGRAVHGHERSRLARTAFVQGARHQLLARAALARHQHGGIGLGDGVDDMAQPATLGRFAEDVGKRRRGGHHLAQPADLLTKLAGLASAVGRHHELLDLEWLGDEIVGPGANGRDGRL
jgi:hypothetical protein